MQKSIDGVQLLSAPEGPRAAAAPAAEGESGPPPLTNGRQHVFYAEKLSDEEAGKWGGRRRLLRLAMDMKAGASTTMDTTTAATHVVITTEEEYEILKLQRLYMGQFAEGAKWLDLRLRGTLRLMTTWKAQEKKEGAQPWWRGGPGDFEYAAEGEHKFPHFRARAEAEGDRFTKLVKDVCGDCELDIQEFMRCYEFVVETGIPVFQGTTGGAAALAFCGGLSWIARTSKEHPKPNAVMLCDGCRMVLVMITDGKKGDPLIVARTQLEFGLDDMARGETDEMPMMLAALREELRPHFAQSKGAKKRYQEGINLLKHVAVLLESDLPRMEDGAPGVSLWTQDQFQVWHQLTRDITKLIERSKDVDQSNPLQMIMFYQLQLAQTSMRITNCADRSRMGGARKDWVFAMSKRDRRLSQKEADNAKIYMQCCVDMHRYLEHYCIMHAYIFADRSHRLSALAMMLNGSSRLALVLPHLEALATAYDAINDFVKMIEAEDKRAAAKVNKK